MLLHRCLPGWIRRVPSTCRACIGHVPFSFRVLPRVDRPRPWWFQTLPGKGSWDTVLSSPVTERTPCACRQSCEHRPHTDLSEKSGTSITVDADFFIRYTPAKFVVDLTLCDWSLIPWASLHLSGCVSFTRWGIVLSFGGFQGPDSERVRC